MSSIATTRSRIAVQVAPAAGAVLASTAPDFDARFLIPVLRGAVALPTRAYYRVAQGMWRQDGTLAAVSEASVRAALAEAPLAILHGDTALFGAPRAVTKGSLLLYAPSADTTRRVVSRGGTRVADLGGAVGRAVGQSRPAQRFGRRARRLDRRCSRRPRAAPIVASRSREARAAAAR